jgi:hypothetical protein
MSANISVFCSDVIADAVELVSEYKPGKKVMTLSMTTDTGDCLTIHFRNEFNFKAFCAKHNFDLAEENNAKF